DLCSGRACGAETRAPSAAWYWAAAATRSGTTIATWLSRPIIAPSIPFPHHCEERSDEAIPTVFRQPARDCFASLAMTHLEPHQLDLDQRPLAEALVEAAAQHPARDVAQGVVVMPHWRREALHRVCQRVAQRLRRLGIRLGEAYQADLRRCREPPSAIDDE